MTTLIFWIWQFLRVIIAFSVLGLLLFFALFVYQTYKEMKDQQKHEKK